MLTSDLEYDLPAELIAMRPAEPRDSARLLVVHRDSDRIEHRLVRDLPAYVHPGDAWVFNETSVIPARLRGERVETGGRVEGLFLEPSTEPAGWVCLLRSNGKLRVGMTLQFTGPGGDRVRCDVVERHGEGWLIQPQSGESTRSAAVELLERVGWTPLPPYILRARSRCDDEMSGEQSAEDRDRAWYQTVYADLKNGRSVAAPTAGLHFTPKLLHSMDLRGARRLRVTLHVGAGTFKPIERERVEEHPMHEEMFEVDRAVIDQIDVTRAAGRSCIAVGTTTVRTLESLNQADGSDARLVGRTSLLIQPPFTFRRVDGLLTNFHLPRSTLLALVGSMTGMDRLKSIYAEAVREKYRFYSYGDAMLILPQEA